MPIELNHTIVAARDPQASAQFLAGILGLHVDPPLARLVIGAVDETGQEKGGEATAGVKRQYLGCAGRVANGINAVHLSYVRDKTGHALIGARQWIPREQIEDPVAALLMGLPLALEFRA